MITRTRLAAAVTGLASFAVVGAALAAEPADPVLEDTTTTTECEEVVDETTDTTVEETTDTTVEETTDTTVEGTTATTIEESEEAEDGDQADDGCEAVEDEVDEVDEVEEPEAVESELETGERPQNHGFYVSEATRTCPESGAERGACISAVAQSDLGKPEQATAHDDTDDDAEGAAVTEEQHGGRPAGVGKAKGARKG